MKFCHQCRYQFSPSSSRFYCCKSEEPVCVTCCRIPCEKCHNCRTIELKKPKCSKCYMSLNGADLLAENNCNKFYCARCLCSIFRNAYEKVQLQKCYDADTQIYVKMFCGHEFSYHALATYFQHFCLECGSQFDSLLDYQFINGTKLCYFCYKYNYQRYKNCFIKCTSCENIMKNSSEVELMDQDGMVLCKSCVEGSKIQETTINKDMSNLNIKQISQQKNQLPTNFNKLQQNQKDFSFSQPNNIKINKKNEQLKSNENKISQNQSKDPFIKSDNNGKSLFDNFLKKPSIQQLKKKQLQRKQSLKQNNLSSSNSFSVTSKFSNEMQDIDDDLTEELGLEHKIKMKKHLSNSTIVSNFKINIPQDNEEFIACKVCNSLVNFNITYDLNNVEKNLNETKSTLVEFSILAESRVSQKNQNFSPICRVCYYNSENCQNSIHNQNKFSPSKSINNNLSNNRPSKLQQSKSSMSYLKVDSLPKRSMHSPSVGSNKQYSLTGSRVSTNNNTSNVPSIIINSEKNLKQPLRPQTSYVSENQSLKKSNIYSDLPNQASKLSEPKISQNFKTFSQSPSNQPKSEGQNPNIRSNMQNPTYQKKSVYKVWKKQDYNDFNIKSRIFVSRLLSYEKSTYSSIQILKKNFIKKCDFSEIQLM